MSGNSAGRSPDVHECVGALVVREGLVLLGRRADDRTWLPGAWDVFGGHIDGDETPEAALRRELAEELGIEHVTLHELGLLQSDAGGWRLRVYAVTAWVGTPVNRQPAEHAALRWMTPDQACAYLSGAHADFGELIDGALVRSRNLVA